MRSRASYTAGRYQPDKSWLCRETPLTCFLTGQCDNSRSRAAQSGSSKGVMHQQLLLLLKHAAALCCAHCTPHCKRQTCVVCPPAGRPGWPTLPKLGRCASCAGGHAWGAPARCTGGRGRPLRLTGAGSGPHAPGACASLPAQNTNTKCWWVKKPDATHAAADAGSGQRALAGQCQ